MFKWLHNRFVSPRRVRVLSREISDFIDSGVTSVLDIGSGDGSISQSILDKNSRLKILGIDVLRRSRSGIPFMVYDGKHIPCDDNSFDACMFVDVLHHLHTPEDVRELLMEARRVCEDYILIKDHVYRSQFDFKILRLMDDVGNKAHGVALEYNYLTEREWEVIFNDVGLETMSRKTKLHLYPFPLNFLFGRKLHFISILKIAK